MKIYVAGSWAQKETCAALMQILEKDGHTITHWWPTFELKYNDIHARSQLCALADVQGVLDCDLLIVDLTLDNYAYKGTNTELGVALAKRVLGLGGPRIWVIANGDPRVDHPELLCPEPASDQRVYPACLRSCFWHTPDDFFPSSDALLVRLRAEK